MKKTLVALAALAATGASFAQVTISGNLTAGYQQNVTNAYAGNLTTRTQSQNQTSGFGVETSMVTFTANEDLGGGQSVKAQLGLVNAVRGAAATTYTGAFGPGDAIISYTNNSIGKFEFGTTRSAAIHSGIPSVGAPTINFDDKLYKALANSDYASYSVAAGPIVGVVKMAETNDAGLGKGQAGAPAEVKQRNVDLTLAYLDGPIKAAFNYVTYDNRNNLVISGANGVAGLTLDQSLALQASYDFGVAKLGFGYAKGDASIGISLVDMLVGLSVPVGAVDLGLTWGSEQTSGAAGTTATQVSPFTKGNVDTLEGTATGWSIGARYNLSKRTNFTINTAQWTRGGYPSFNTQNQAAFLYGPVESQTNVLLSHSF